MGTAGSRTYRTQLGEKFDWARVYCDVKVTGESGDWAQGYCPKCEEPGRSKSPSASIGKKSNYFICRGKCGFKGDVFEYMAWKYGRTVDDLMDEAAIEFQFPRKNKPKESPKHEVDRYRYENLKGEVCWKRRWQHDDGRKSFSWEHHEKIHVTFWLAEKIKDLPKSQPLFVVEGEKKVKMFAERGLRATTLPHGAGPGKSGGIPREDWAALFTDRTVYVLPDNDEKGKPFGIEVAARMQSVTPDVYLVPLPVQWGEGPDDWFDKHGGTVEALTELCSKAKRFMPEEHPEAKLLRGMIVDRYGDPAHAVDCLESCLLENWARMEPLFVRGSEMMRLGVDGNLHCVRRETLIEMLGRFVDYEREDDDGERKKGEIRDRIVDTYLSRRGSWKLPQLRAVTRAPFVTPDGRVYSTPGYCEEFKVYLHWSGDPIEVPDNITRDDAGRAAMRLMSVFSESPFIGACDDVATMLALLTAVQRPILESAPMFAITAPTPSSGKSIIANACSVIATGKVARVRVYSDDPEEFGKELFAAMLGSQQVILLDNVACDMDSPILCQLLTEPFMSRRMLGSLQDAEVPTCATVFATGNNISVLNDLLTRTVFIQLDPKMENPESRVFKKDLIASVIEDRRLILRDAMILLAGYARAGYPTPKMDSRFKGWTRTVRSAALWVGLSDPMERTYDQKRLNPAVRFLKVWRQRYGGQDMAVGRLLEDAERDVNDSEWREAIAEIIGSKPTIPKLSRWLSRHEGRWFGGIYLKHDTAKQKWRTS